MSAPLPEDPPYSPDSVFRPNEHRSRIRALPENALFAEQPFTADGMAAFSYFGSAIAVDGRWAIVGAPFADEDGAMDSGSAHVFERRADGWWELAKLTAPDPSIYDHFGRSVAVSDSLLLVGADGADPGGLPEAGLAYVFERRSGADGRVSENERIELEPPTARSHAAFGYSVAIDGPTLAVGAPGDGSGAIYLFERGEAGDWRCRAELRIEALSKRAGLGHALAFDRGRLLAGAPMASGTEVLAGAAFLFERQSEWRSVIELRPTVLGGGDRFGRAVALDGDLALVGAPRARVDDRTRAGRVWAFERREGIWQARPPITASPPRSDAELGRTVALGPRFAVIGSQFDDAVGQATGGALLFELDADRELRVGAPLLAADPEPMNEFASAAAVGENEILVGAPRRGEGHDATGFVYTYSAPEAPETPIGAPR